MEPGSEVTLHCSQHNVSSFAMLSMVITVPCGNEHVEVYGPQDYADHILHGEFKIISNFSTHIKEKMACCNFTVYDTEVHPNNHQLYNCTLILPMSIEEDGDNKGKHLFEYINNGKVIINRILNVIYYCRTITLS